MSAPRWTVTALTIPGRENYLRQLIQSIEASVIPGGARLVIVYNRAIRDELADVERMIRSWVADLDIEVHFNNGDPTISGGRNYQLNLVKTPLVCFVDDDITVHGDAFHTVEEAMRKIPAGLVGLRSYREDTDELFKPRDSTPHVITPDFATSRCTGCSWRATRTCFATWAGSIRGGVSGASGPSSTCACGGQVSRRGTS